ncbi:hypothetical protein [Streptococcus anginosus]|uniref:hypothetical protein n=1 Tax=Streptococcus anginosus TaxID=1328 RepID=UPI0023A9D041|nr:hypothetical protein [Streptococcus anginosus]WEB04326.1 hypothetical protein PUW62_09305 [Streptococcus anginosus]
MAETFDYVGFARDFEKRYGRPPTSEELEKGIDPLEGMMRIPSKEEVETEMARINASYKPSFGERLKTGLSFLGRNGIKAFVLLLQTPIYLTLFFFNLIKSTIGVAVIYVVTKGIVGVLLSEFLSWGNVETLSQTSNLFRFFAQDFMTDKLEPIYFTEIDIIICIIFTFLLALVATFSKTET